MARKTKRAQPAPIGPGAIKTAETLPRVRHWIEKWYWALASAAVLIATVRIVATYPVFNHTIDEPAHIACGMEWLAKGTYSLEPQHPPLARIFTALGPFLAGERSQGRPQMYNEGAAILYHDGKYERNLTLARLGVLPFFWLACGVLFAAGIRWYGKAQAAVATLLFTLLPPVLAHASLATTDMPLTAGVGAAIFALLAWAETPTLRWGVATGVGCGIAFTTKFSSLLFVPVAFGGLLVWRMIAVRGMAPLKRLCTTKHAISALVTAAVCATFIWGVYRFSLENGTPAPALFRGLSDAYKHRSEGHPSYLLGQRNKKGFLMFYPVALAVKTPLGFLLLMAGGLYFAWRERKKVTLFAPAVLALAILAVGLYSRINIGTRHILPIYFFLSLLAGFSLWKALEEGGRRTWLAWIAGLMLVWTALSGAINHPDYLAYFNEFGGSEPERILADSDLDWGQDMLRLAARLRELRAPGVSFNPFISAYLHEYHGFPPISPSSPQAPNYGWNAVSTTVWKVARMGLMDDMPGMTLWPDVMKPTERVGRGVLLYYVAPNRPPGAR